MSCSTDSPKHRRFSKKRGKSCDSHDPQRVLGLDLGEQTLNAKGAGLHGCWSSRAQRLSCRQQPRASNPRICTADHLPPRAAGMPTAGEARPRPFRGKRRRGVKARVASLQVHGIHRRYPGILSKRKDSAYRSGRCREWVKKKNPDASAATREAEEDWS
jgi:hypothetical protein